MPLTQEQFQKARDAGFSTEQIIGFEKRRGTEAEPKLNVFPKFSANPLEGDTTTITPTDITTGMFTTVPMKAISALDQGAREYAGGLLKKEFMPGIRNRNKILPTSLPDIGGITPEQKIASNLLPLVNPREIVNKGAEIAIDVASSPSTYMLAGADKPLSSLSNKIESVLPKAVEDVAPGVGQKGLSIFKQGRDYLYNKVAKPISEMISNNVKNNPEIGKSLGLKPDTIDLIKKYGYDAVSNPQAADDLAKEAFNIANSKKATVYGDKINIADTVDLIKKKFKAIRKVDPNNPLGKVLQNVKGLQPAPEGFYKTKVPTPGQIQRQLKGENLIDIAREARISREEFSNIRQQIDNLYKARVINKGDVLEIVDSLYNDAEKSGLEGIQKARELYHQARQFEDVASNISKIEKLDTVKVHTDLNSVVKDPTKYQGMVDKYTPYLGKDVAKKIFNEALAVRRGGKIIKRTAGAGLLGVGIKTGYGILH